MNAHRIASAALVVLALAGCSNGSDPLVTPLSTESSRLLPGAPPIEQSNAPRIHVSSDTGWRSFQKAGGVFLTPDWIVDLAIADERAVTFRWSALPAGQIVGYRWSLDLEDITDETPRLNDADLRHWSPWSLSDVSATIGPFAAGESHFLYIEARSNVGKVSLMPIHLTVSSDEITREAR